MSKLPYSRVVNVTMSRKDAFPSRRGFGVPILLTNTAVAGELDATERTKLYSTMDEVAVDHASSSDFYLAAEAAFSQNPRPLQLKGAFITFTPPSSAAVLKTQLDAVYDYDPEWYWITLAEKELRDIAALDGLVEWTEAKNKFSLIDSNDSATESAATATSLAGRHKGTVERTAVFYHTDINEFPGVALAALLGTHNFDNANSAYTAKFKRLRSVTPIDRASSVVQAVTGFTPQLGQSEAAGHMANTYIDIGGRDFVVEGSTLTPSVFIDEIHATDWIIARTEEETLAILLNNERIPYTDKGMEQLATGARTVMRQADNAGIIANDLDPETGEYKPAVEFSIPSVFSVPESQRKARIAPVIAVTFRYAGAVHYTTINYFMTF